MRWASKVSAFFVQLSLFALLSIIYTKQAQIFYASERFPTFLAGNRRDFEGWLHHFYRAKKDERVVPRSSFLEIWVRIKWGISGIGK